MYAAAAVAYNSQQIGSMPSSWQGNEASSKLNSPSSSSSSSSIQLNNTNNKSQNSWQMPPVNNNNNTTPMLSPNSMFLANNSNSVNQNENISPQGFNSISNHVKTESPSNENNTNYLSVRTFPLKNFIICLS